MSSDVKKSLVRPGEVPVADPAEALATPATAPISGDDGNNTRRTFNIPASNSDGNSCSHPPTTTDAAVQTTTLEEDPVVTQDVKLGNNGGRGSPTVVGPTIIRLQAVSPTTSVTVSSSRHSSVSSLASTSDSCQAVVGGGGTGAVTKAVAATAATLIAGLPSSTVDRRRLQSAAATKSNLNQAMAIVANKWDREQRKQDQEVTRRLTVLRQRKISAVLKVGQFVTSVIVLIGQCHTCHTIILIPNI